MEADQSQFQTNLYLANAIVYVLADTLKLEAVDVAKTLDWPIDKISVSSFETPTKIYKITIIPVTANESSNIETGDMSESVKAEFLRFVSILVHQVRAVYAVMVMEHEDTFVKWAATIENGEEKLSALRVNMDNTTFFLDPDCHHIAINVAAFPIAITPGDSDVSAKSEPQAISNECASVSAESTPGDSDVSAKSEPQAISNECASVSAESTPGDSDVSASVSAESEPQAISNECASVSAESN